MIDLIKKHPYKSIGVLVLLTVVIFYCCIFLISLVQIGNEERGIREEKGELVSGVSSGLQEIASDIDERHIYTYEGIRGETIRIHATTSSNVLFFISVYAPGQDRSWHNYRGDLEGQRGDDVEIIKTLPVDGIYKIYVGMADVGGAYEIQVDIIE